MDWPSCEPARLAAAKVRRLASLRTRGVAGWLAGAAVSSGPAAAVTLATGVQPEIHGIWRKGEAWAGGVRPIGRASWRLQPVWSRLEAAGVSTGSVCWPASRPGDDWPGLHVDNSFAEPTGADHRTWALPLHCAPATARESLRDRRVHPNQIADPVLAPFVAGADAQPTSVQIEALRTAIAQAATVQAAAVWMLSGEDQTAPDAVFVHQAFLRDVRDAFAGASPTLVDRATATAWSFLDGLIGRLMELCSSERSILLVSPGWGGAAGAVMAAGPGVKANPTFDGASILDIAPTVLAWFGLQDTGLPGRSLAPLPAATPPRVAPCLPPPQTSASEADLCPGLQAQGYALPKPASAAWLAAGAAELAALLLDRDPQAALRAADEALAADPNQITALRIKSRAHVALGQDEPLMAIGERLNTLAPERGWGATAIGAAHALRGKSREAAPWLKRAENETDIATLTAVATLWTALGRLGDATRTFRRLASIDPGNVTAEIGLAMAATARRDFLEAEAALQRARAREPSRPAIWLQLAQIYAATGRKSDAARMAAKARRLGALPALADAAATGRLG